MTTRQAFWTAALAIGFASISVRGVSAADVAIQEGTATFSQSIGGGNTPDQVYDLDLGDSNGWAVGRS